MVEFLKKILKNLVGWVVKFQEELYSLALQELSKTLLARAIAGEAGVHVSHRFRFSILLRCSLELGASRVRDMFDQGKKKFSMYNFIDEIDAVGRSRGAGLGGGNDEREQTLGSSC